MHQVALDGAVALRRRCGRDLGLDARIGFGNLLRPRVVGLQHLVERHRRDASDRELLGALEERPSIDVAVYVLVEDVEEFLRKVRSLLSLHCTHSFKRPVTWREVYKNVEWPGG